MTNARAKYQAPRLEVQRLRDLPIALASSGCRITPSKNSVTCSSGNATTAPKHP